MCAKRRIHRYVTKLFARSAGIFRAKCGNLVGGEAKLCVVNFRISGGIPEVRVVNCGNPVGEPKVCVVNLSKSGGELCKLRKLGARILVFPMESL